MGDGSTRHAGKMDKRAQIAIALFVTKVGLVEIAVYFYTNVSLWNSAMKMKEKTANDELRKRKQHKMESTPEKRTARKAADLKEAKTSKKLKVEKAAAEEEIEDKGEKAAAEEKKSFKSKKHSNQTKEKAEKTSVPEETKDCEQCNVVH